MAVFCRDIAAVISCRPADYAAVHRWSVSERAHFWKEVLVYGKLIYHGEFTAAYRVAARYYAELRGKYARRFASRAGNNLQCKRRRGGFVLYIGTTDGCRQKNGGVIQEIGVKSGDRIAAVVPNADIPVVCFLAAAAIGAVWASASPDQGPEGITDRFAQIEPVLPHQH
ncbi:hypothetical protein CHS0354_035255 [Potamilus streckersoni]|uniref:Uncharacterized protein n=1 Tax=Potamilus streckersoni TaxID=2493646 RepID=A0AAE0VNA1_9BIVA|nr:hypothetical protein CHS0354_035255 [Potamilus streckersoni]